MDSQATKDAGAMASLNALGIIDEPTATAIAHGLDKKGQDNRVRNVLIFDLGGCSLEISILTVENGIVQVKTTANEHQFGDQEIDIRMVNHFVEEFKGKWNPGLFSKAKAGPELCKACESLTHSDVAFIDIIYFMRNIFGILRRKETYKIIIWAGCFPRARVSIILEALT